MCKTRHSSVASSHPPPAQYFRMKYFRRRSRAPERNIIRHSTRATKATHGLANSVARAPRECWRIFVAKFIRGVTLRLAEHTVRSRPRLRHAQVSQTPTLLSSPPAAATPMNPSSQSSTIYTLARVHPFPFSAQLALHASCGRDCRERSDNTHACVLHILCYAYIPPQPLDVTHLCV